MERYSGTILIGGPVTSEQWKKMQEVEPRLAEFDPTTPYSGKANSYDLTEVALDPRRHTTKSTLRIKPLPCLSLNRHQKPTRRDSPCN